MFHENKTKRNANCTDLNLSRTFVPDTQVTLLETVFLLLTVIAKTVGKIPITLHQETLKFE